MTARAIWSLHLDSCQRSAGAAAGAACLPAELLLLLLLLLLPTAAAAQLLLGNLGPLGQASLDTI
jgi:hypothetical protein